MTRHRQGHSDGESGVREGNKNPGSMCMGGSVCIVAEGSDVEDSEGPNEGQ